MGECKLSICLPYNNLISIDNLRFVSHKLTDFNFYGGKIKTAENDVCFYL